jgi:hypothetical protein
MRCPARRGGTGRQAARPARARPGAAARSAVALIQYGSTRQLRTMIVDALTRATTGRF